jgi:predicted nucleic acid-binding Zn ribbon protein
MPNYDYYCESNGRTVEVSHRMAESLGTWGELCERAGLAPGKTPRSAPVRKLISGAAVHTGHRTGKGMATAPPCETTGVCCGGGCSTTH